MKRLLLLGILCVWFGWAIAQKPLNTNIVKKELSERLQFVKPTALRVALADFKKSPGYNVQQGEAWVQQLCVQLPEVQKSLQNGENGVTKAKEYLQLHRRFLMSNPLLDADRMVAVRFHLGEKARNCGAGSLGTPNSNYSSLYSSVRMGPDAEIVELSNLRNETPAVRTIYKPDRKVNIADLQMHWNADRLLFSSLDEKNRWQVYEVGMDGKGMHQKVVVNEPDLDFCDANYLPDGRIILSSNIGYQGVPCVHGDDEVSNMSLYDPKDGSFRRLTFDQDGNWNPVVMNNGRVMYTRWEYTDLTHYYSRMVMHMNPDGTENKSLYGSGSFFPNSIFDMKPLPGSASRFVGIITGHHGVVRSGRLIVFDPAKSRKEEKGMIQEIPFRDRPIVPIIKDYLVDGVWPQFVRPMPLNDNYFLVTAKLSKEGLWGIYLVDVYDNMTCVVEFEGEGFISPQLCVKRPVPPTIPDRVNLADREATIFIQDIYEGEGSMGLPRGVVKELRIFAYEYAYWRSISDHDGMGIQSGWDIKRALGTVPVEADGSVLFKVPANTPISIQPLDEKGRAVQWMRSWFTPMPGETVSCIGCHEDQNQIPMPKRVMASQMKPHALKQPAGGVHPFTFDMEIQPILDRACVACHTGENGVKDLRGTETKTYKRGRLTKIVRPYHVSYLNLMPHLYRQGPEADMYVLKPYEYHASNSELIRMLEKGHHGVKLTDEEWRTMYNWVDFNVPYSGRFQTTTKTDGKEQYGRRIELARKYNPGAGVDWKQELTDYAAYLKSRGVVQAVRPEAITKKYANVRVSGWPFSVEEAVKQQGNKQIREVEIAPGVKMRLVWVPAGKFVMGSNEGEPDVRPAFKTEVKKGFWMSETEVTNAQFCALFPEHDSRIIGQHWKDHTTAGYWANKPHQPVIRVSCEEAMAFCRKVGERIGAAVALPTETQWEWACRAGSSNRFWYGGLADDFGRFENMADASLSDMSVEGVNPKPMAKDNPLREFWDYLPKVSGVNDGCMLADKVGGYEPNAWGLKDMHGNVAEWTSSDYLPYPLKVHGTSDRKVVRGGSWTDRPCYSAADSRRAYHPWQRPYNVGFRLIME